MNTRGGATGRAGACGVPKRKSRPTVTLKSEAISVLYLVEPRGVEPDLLNAMDQVPATHRLTSSLNPSLQRRSRNRAILVLRENGPYLPGLGYWRRILNTFFAKTEGPTPAKVVSKALLFKFGVKAVFV
jgi:hypothetical protein